MTHTGYDISFSSPCSSFLSVYSSRQTGLQRYRYKTKDKPRRAANGTFITTMKEVWVTNIGKRPVQMSPLCTEVAWHRTSVTTVFICVSARSCWHVWYRLAVLRGRMLVIQFDMVIAIHKRMTGGYRSCPVKGVCSLVVKNIAWCWVDQCTTKGVW